MRREPSCVCMPGLSIKPHSPRVTGYAVAGLSLVALGAFGMGLHHQMGFNGPAYFPAGPAQRLQARAQAIPEATPAPDMQLAVAEPPSRAHHPRPAADDDANAAAAPAAPAVAAPAAPLAAADAAATEADPAAPTPDAPPSETPEDPPV